MKRGLYLRLARTNLVKNKKLYLPYLLTGIGMIMVFYIVMCLSVDPEVKAIPGGDTLTVILGFGVFVVGIFSALFLFYISGFITKQRKREFGLYNVLGMGKRHIARVMFYENIIVAGVCVLGGVVLGAVFSKLAQLCLIKLMDAEAPLTFNILPLPIIVTCAVYLFAFMLVHLNALKQLAKSKTIELLHGSSTGEKPPKGNILIALFGLICLGIGYALALMVSNPISAMVMFFIAVIFVIIGTYALFISGSVAICKLLKKNKGYYYKAAHFVSVSGMAYRMKRNGAGLASICILSTMVLVVMSSVTCLFVGAEESMRDMYPRDFTFQARSDDEVGYTWLRETVDEKLAEYGYKPKDEILHRELTFALTISEGKAVMNRDDRAALSGDFSQIYIMPLEDFNSETGANEKLDSGEALILLSEGNDEYKWDEISFSDEKKFKVRRYEGANIQSFDNLPGFGIMKLVVPGMDDVYDIWDIQKSAYEDYASSIQMVYGFNLSANRAAQVEFYDDLLNAVRKRASTNKVNMSYGTQSYAANRDDFYSFYAGLFFLGIVLGLTFAAASVLIMYYKQVTEGYEDQSRFAIMQNVGMTNAEIKKSINSQVLIVFFLPLVASVTHLLFAYSMIKYLLSLFGLTNTPLFMTITLISILTFSILYALVYMITSRAYYSIVSARGDARVYGVQGGSI